MDGGSLAIPLAQLRGFRIANGALDMRLWHVHSEDGRRIGCVDELLVDPATMEVHYLDVEVENLLATGRERHVLIPAGNARPDEERSGTLMVDGLPARAVGDLPTYPRGTAVRGDDTDFARPFAAAEGPARLDFPVRVAPAEPTTSATSRKAGPPRRLRERHDRPDASSALA